MIFFSNDVQLINESEVKYHVKRFPVLHHWAVLISFFGIVLVVPVIYSLEQGFVCMAWGGVWLCGRHCCCSVVSIKPRRRFFFLVCVLSLSNGFY